MSGRVPRVLRTDAVVLRHRRLGEADRIVTLLTPGRGKVDAVAKGALRPRSRLAGHLDPLTRVQVLLAYGRSLDIVTQAEGITAFPAVRADLDRLGLAMYLAEVADRMTVEHHEADAIYAALVTALLRLERGDGLQLVGRSFELAVLEASGLRPEWSACAGCRAPLPAAPGIVWSALAGGVLCAVCRAGQDAVLPLDPTVLKVLRAYQALPYEEAARIRLTPELAAGMERVMHTLMQSVAEREIGTAHFVTAARRARHDPSPGGAAPGDRAPGGGMAGDAVAGDPSPGGAAARAGAATEGDAGRASSAGGVR